MKEIYLTKKYTLLRKFLLILFILYVQLGAGFKVIFGSQLPISMFKLYKCILRANTLKGHCNEKRLSA